VPDFVAIAVVGIGTYVMRVVFIVALANKRIPETVLVALRYVGPAVLTALIVTLLADTEGNVEIGLPEVAGFIAGGVVAYRTRSQIWTLFAGMTVFWVVRALV
jgi:branched-subunit amino acid transport protein